MFGFVFLLAPFIASALWFAFEGDRLREPGADEADEPIAAPSATAGSDDQRRVTAVARPA